MNVFSSAHPTPNRVSRIRLSTTRIDSGLNASTPHFVHLSPYRLDHILFYIMPGTGAL
ncbi:MAG: hypothetical protein U9N12_07180 [Euryarchaeota archaeon]|nr:hypothetical protein [Euryarchaeota archaeon]